MVSAFVGGIFSFIDIFHFWIMPVNLISKQQKERKAVIEQY
jgi:hypothetical protein